MAEGGPKDSPKSSYDAGCEERLSPLFTWRSAVASQFGPSKPTTRHVLLTLSLHMNERGGSCFPSTETLALETGLSQRSVEEHLRVAEQGGWIRRRGMGLAGQGWRKLTYTAAVPDSARRGLREERDRDEMVTEGAEPASARPKKVRKITAKGAEGRSGKDVSEDVKKLHADPSDRTASEVEFNLGDERTSPAKKPRTQTIPMSMDWLPPDSIDDFATEIGVTSSYVDRQLAPFRRYFIGRQTRRSDANWVKSFRTWIANQVARDEKAGISTNGKHKGPAFVRDENGTRILHR